MNNLLYTLFVAAALALGAGVVLAFVDPAPLHLRISNEGYVSALFSLASVILFVAALIYQKRELHQQLLDSGRSADALQEQKSILLEQNHNMLMLGIIDNFTEYKERLNVEKTLELLAQDYGKLFGDEWDNIHRQENHSGEEADILFALRIKNIFTSTIGQHPRCRALKQYVQFVYNILLQIEISNKNFSRDNFTSLFFVQLTSNEVAFIHLANLVDIGMGIFTELHWSTHATEDIIRMIGGNVAEQCDHNDISILTQKFNELKQKSYRRDGN